VSTSFPVSLSGTGKPCRAGRVRTTPSSRPPKFKEIRARVMANKGIPGTAIAPAYSGMLVCISLLRPHV